MAEGKFRTEKGTGRIIGNSIAALSAFLAVTGFNLLYQIRGESTMLSNSVFGALAFGAFLYLGLRFFQGGVSRRLAVFSLAGGLLFAALTAFGFSLNYTDTIWNSEVFPALLCLTPFFGVCTGFGLRALSGRRGRCRKKQKTGRLLACEALGSAVLSALRRSPFSSLGSGASGGLAGNFFL